MASIFSDVPGPVDVPEPPPRTVRLDIPRTAAEAFDGFTDGIHLWWPVSTHSSFGADSQVGFDGDQLVEESLAGDHELWGEIDEWQPPSSLVLRWYAGGSPLSASRVRVTFSAAAEGGTCVTLVHDEWAAGTAGLQQYEQACDWPLILGNYARFMGGAVLLH